MQLQFRRWIAAGCVIGALLTGIVGPVYAQDDGGGEEAVDTGDIYGFRTEIVFPAVVRFIVGVNVAPEDIVSAALTVRQEDDFELTVTLDPEDDVFNTTGASTELVYDWGLPGRPPLTPFVPLNFRWAVETRSGGISTAVGESIFEDVRPGDWESTGQPPLVLHWTNDNLAGGSIWNDVMAAYGLLNRHTGLSPFFEFAIYDPDADLCMTVDDPEADETRQIVLGSDDKEYACSVQAYENIYAAGGMTFLQRPTFGYAELQDALVSEMVRGTYTLHWAGLDVPAWFLNGLAFLYHLHPETAALDIVRDEARTESLESLDDLADPLPESASRRERIVWDAQSYLLVLYLAERYGADASFEFAVAIPGFDDGFAGALRDLTGGDQDDLWDEWLRWLFLDEAVRAVNWTPYLPVTPTPTATATATVPPPTYTPSNTPTITFTPSSTFLGDQLPTPIVITLTATQTRPPTNTPRPPGSLPTVTPIPPSPVPEVTPEADGSDTVPVPIAVGIILAASIIAIGVVVAVRRRR